MSPQPGYIANRSLTLHEVPDLLVESLDLSEPVGGGRTPEEWDALWTFALTYDGYAYFGGDNGAGPRLGAFAESVKRAFLAHGQLPNLDLRLLRACLFFEQRVWCKASDGPMDEPSARYLSYLLRAIRADLTS